MTISPIELNSRSNAILHVFAVTNNAFLLEASVRAVRTLVFFTTSTLCLRPGHFPQSQHGVVEKKGIEVILLRVPGWTANLQCVPPHLLILPLK